ncbi:MAG: SIS domain-containing protein [Candidatus Electryoneaceae bacterium]|nr:SIS domain-containing protein [Candidatus Electryoneaceae bacterium]
MDTLLEIRRRLDEHIETATKMDTMLINIVSAVEMVVETFRAGGKLLLAGNGGSSADAQHWAAEWIIRLNPKLNRPAMAAIALSTDTSVITAGANDIGYENVFSRQIEALALSGDLFIAISTSGNSENLIRAAKLADEKNVRVLGILGKGGGRIVDYCDHSVIIPSDNTQRIQEMQEFVGHMLCELSEEILYSSV